MLKCAAVRPKRSEVSDEKAPGTYGFGRGGFLSHKSQDLGI